VPAGHDLDVASSKSRDLDDSPGSLTKEATMNPTGAVARANFQIAGILLWFAPRSIMMRKLFRQVTIVAFTSLSLISASLADDPIVKHSTKAHAAKSAHLPAGSAAKTKAQPSTKAHRLVIQVDQNDPAVMNLALNNATNVIDYYRAKGEDVNVDVVTYGPGLHMLRADTSPVQDRIKNLKDHAFPSKVQFSACGNTKEGMEKKEGHPITVLSEAVVVPSGVVRLMELQEKGWSYVRP
jgi:intracellular sulfur oxidation DsrE/DsrF family protein